MSERRVAYVVEATAPVVSEAPAAIIAQNEQAVICAMRAVERASRPGLLALYYNGSGWLLYDNTQPHYLGT